MSLKYYDSIFCNISNMKITKRFSWTGELIETLKSKLVRTSRSCNIQTAPAYGVYISQLICYAGACSLYSDFTMSSYSEY